MAAVIKKQYLKLYRGSHFPLEQWYTIDTLVLYNAAITNGAPDSLAEYLNNNVDMNEFEKLNIATFTDFEVRGGYPHGELMDDPAYPDSQYIYVMAGDNNNSTNGYPYLGPNKEDGVPQSGNIAYLYFNGTPTQMSGDVYDLPSSQRPNLTGQYVAIDKDYIDLTYRDAYTVKAFYCIIPTTFSTTNRKYHLFRAAVINRYVNGEIVKVFSVAAYGTTISQLKFDNVITDTNERPFAPVLTDPYAPVKPTAPNGGNGGYGYGEGNTPTINDIPFGTTEVNDSNNSMYTRYLINMSELSRIGDWFWADDLGLAIAKTVISAFYGNPVDTIISCVSYPFNVGALASTTSGNMYWGGDNSNISAQILNTNAIQIHWGSVTISEYFSNFLDYSPHTKIQLFLPWGTGFVDIDPSDVFQVRKNQFYIPSQKGSGSIEVITNIDLSKGLCVHNVACNGAVIGAYSGSCGRQVPITGSDYASKQVALAGAAIGAMVAGGIAVGSAVNDMITGATTEFLYTTRGDITQGSNLLTVDDQSAMFGYSDRFASGVNIRRGEITPYTQQLAANAARPAIASAAAVGIGQPHVSRSGSFQEGTGGMTIQYPYLLISRPLMSKPKTYGHEYGYPSNISTSLGSLSGYTEVGAVHLDGIPATVGEITEIDSLLKGGVIL